MVGKAPVILDFEPSPGEGHELAAFAAVLKRVFQRFHGFEGGLADIVLGDGLYITTNMLNLCRKELKTHLLVKTTELPTRPFQAGTCGSWRIAAGRSRTMDSGPSTTR
jgi:hypothetical protein